MNYKRIYDQLIERARKTSTDEKVENHHILPKCLGGCDDDDNLVELTCREHFIAHLLLAKMHPMKLSLSYAVARMSEYGRYNSKDYSRLRKKYHELQSVPYSDKYSEERSLEIRNKISKTLTGRKQPPERYAKYFGHTPWNKGKPLSKEHREAVSKGRSGIAAWNKGLPSCFKGKTYEEIFGEERAKDIKSKKWENNSQRGKKLSEEHKEKIRATTKKYVITEEQAQKQRDACFLKRGKPWSEARRKAEELRKLNKERRTKQ